ncbi:MAG: CBS domain-containing protein [Bdellovibrionales bacterium]|nr:CBS domain-containing protein [Bdellovibrionales bacterium]
MSDDPKKKKTPAYQPPISSKLAGTPINHFMSRKVIYATPTTSVRVAMEMMLTHKISGLVVIDDTESCLGVYSEMDAMLQGASQSLAVPIRYTKPPLVVHPETIFREVLVLMVQKKLKRLPVVDKKKKVVGIISRRDLMRAIHDDTQQETPV